MTLALAGWIRRSILSEGGAVIAAAFLATLVAEWRTISNANIFPVDSTIHTYWMFQFEDPELFRGDPLSADRTGQVPPALLLLYRLASVVMSPVTVSKLLPLLIAPFAVWLVFRITRSIAPWRPAAWLAALVYLFAWDVHRFSGGHARAFAVPITLSTVLLAMRGRDRVAGAVPPLGAVLYPPGAITALGILGFSSIHWRRWPPWNRRRILVVAGSTVLVAAAILGTRLLWPAGQSGGLASSRAEIERSPEFGPRGQRPYFADSASEFLRQNRSGFHLRRSGAIIFLAAGLILLVRPRNARLLPRELWAIPLGSLVLFVLAHALLPRLYWPHRYTYALLPFSCIVIGVALRPTFDALRGRVRRRWILSTLAVASAASVVLLALTVFPLGPGWGAYRLQGYMRAALALSMAAIAVASMALLMARRSKGALPTAGVIAASLAGATLIGSVAAAGKVRGDASACAQPEVLSYLSTLPKASMIAGDPFEVQCVPIVAKRPVVMSTKLYNTADRQRMMDVLQAYYGPSVAAILALHERYSADYLVVRPSILEATELPRRWQKMEPFTTRLRALLDDGQRPAALSLAPECRRYLGNDAQVFDLSCVAASAQ